MCSSSGCFRAQSQESTTLADKGPILFRKIEPQNYLNVINNFHAKLKFTIEIENNNSISFLDILIQKLRNCLVVTIYRIPAHSGRYLNFLSNQPYNTKFGIVTRLFIRAQNNCSEEYLLKQEFNNYPKHTYYIPQLFGKIHRKLFKIPKNEQICKRVLPSY